MAKHKRRKAKQRKSKANQIPTVHRFGQFIIPDGAYICSINNVAGTNSLNIQRGDSWSYPPREIVPGY